MTKKYIRVCFVLLVIMLSAAAGISTFGTTYARYVNTVYSRTVIESPKVSGSCFSGKDEAKLTVLVGEKTEATFTIESESDISGKLEWSTPVGAAVKMKIGDEVIEQGASVDVKAGEPVNVTMTVGGNTALAIDVNWGEMLFGTFIFSPEGGSEEEQTAAVNTEAEGGNTEKIEINTVPVFDLAKAVPMEIVFPKNADKVLLGINGDGTVGKFPKGTRISTDGGKTFYLLYSGGVFETEKIKIEGNVIIDLSRTKLNSNEIDEINIQAEAYINKLVVEAEKTVECINGELEKCETVISRKEETADLQIGENPSESEAKTEKVNILSVGDSILMYFPTEWVGDEYGFEWSLEILTIKDGEKAYETVVMAESGISGLYTDDAEDHSLKISIDEIPRAGTYRINMKWKYNDFCFYETKETFFIDYSNYSDSTFES